MANSNLISAIKKSGIKKSAIAKKLNMSINSFNNKLSGRTEFTTSEAINLLRLLGVETFDFNLYFCE